MPLKLSELTTAKIVNNLRCELFKIFKLLNCEFFGLINLLKLRLVCKKMLNYN